MKHTRRIPPSLSVLVPLLLLLLLASCAKGQPSETAAPADTTAPTETSAPAETEPAEPGPGQENRDFLDDYLKIEPAGEHDAKCLFLSLGKADAILVSVDRTVWLIDTGTTISPPLITAGLKDLGADSLAGIFITHTDADHIGGLETLLSVVDVPAVYTSSITADWNKIESLRGDTERVALDPGAVVPAADGVWFEVLGPYRYNPRDDNNSLVLRLRVNGSTVIFAGDMMKAEENTLLSAGLDLSCDLLKVGHHGKKDASSDAFLAAAAPQYAVITADRSDEDDSAHKSVLKALKKVGAVTVVTDEVKFGILATLLPDGKITIGEQKPAKAPASVALSSVSKEDQLAVLKNTGSTDVDLSGWWLISEIGKELFRFPDGTVLSAGAELSVGCLDYEGTPDLRWNEGKVWHKSKEDIAALIDCWGNTVSELPSA